MRIDFEHYPSVINILPKIEIRTYSPFWMIEFGFLSFYLWVDFKKRVKK